jgi:hypothetical protein
MNSGPVTITKVLFNSGMGVLIAKLDEMAMRGQFRGPVPCDSPRYLTCFTSKPTIDVKSISLELLRPGKVKIPERSVLAKKIT